MNPDIPRFQGASTVWDREKTTCEGSGTPVPGPGCHNLIVAKPSLIKIGNRILNLNAVKYVELGPGVVNVYFVDHPASGPLQFTGLEAQAFLALLGPGYMTEIEVSGFGDPKP